MSLLFGAKKVKLDSRNRIFVISLLAKYLGLSKGEDSGVDYTIAFPVNDNDPSLIILNSEMTEDQYEKIKKKDDDKLSLFKSPIEEKDNGKEDKKRKVIENMRTGEIKTQKIQLYKSEVDQLNMPKGDNSIVLDFRNGETVRIWAEKVFKKKFKKAYKRFGLGDEGDE